MIKCKRGGCVQQGKEAPDQAGFFSGLVWGTLANLTVENV